MNRLILSIPIFILLGARCVSHLEVSKEDFFEGELDEEEYIIMLKDESQIHVHTPKIRIRNDSLFVEGLYRSSEFSNWTYYKDTISQNEIKFIEYPRHTSAPTPTAQIVYWAFLGTILVLVIAATSK